MKHKKDVQELVKLSLIIILAVQFCLIMYSNLTMIEKNLDCDTGKLFNHIAEIWRQKQLLLPNWDYLTTLEWDCSSLFALPFYVLTGDIILSFGMANILCLGGFLYIVFYLFKGEDALYPLLCANLLIIPYRVGMLDYYNIRRCAVYYQSIAAAYPDRNYHTDGISFYSGRNVCQKMEEYHSAENRCVRLDYISGISCAGAFDFNIQRTVCNSMWIVPCMRCLYWI